MLCVALGAAVFTTGVFSFVPDPRSHGVVAERLTEFVVIMSLMGAGLKLDRPLGWRRWASTWRLLAIGMPLTIAATAWLGVTGLGFSLAIALLLGAAMAPTDPVLASDVQVGPPRSGDEDEVRFGLTSEAGFNDALAFPFVHLAILATTVGGLASPRAMSEWFAVDVVWKLAAGGGVGYLVGKGLGRLIFAKGRESLSRAGDGLIALAATLLAYAAAELVHGYGFLAVFVAALTLRAGERNHEFNDELHRMADYSERLLMMVTLVLFGGAIASGVLSALTWTDAALCLVVVLIVRPVAGMVALAGMATPLRDKALISFLGIRGIGSIYYLAYGLNHGDFGDSKRLWGVVCCIILVSIVVHGVTASPLLLSMTRPRPKAENDSA